MNKAKVVHPVTFTSAIPKICQRFYSTTKFIFTSPVTSYQNLSDILNDIMTEEFSTASKT